MTIQHRQTDPPFDDVTVATLQTICDALLTQGDRDVSAPGAIVGILRDAASSCAADPGEDGEVALQRSVADLISWIVCGASAEPAVPAPARRPAAPLLWWTTPPVPSLSPLPRTAAPLMKSA